MEKKQKPNIISKKPFDFAPDIIRLYQNLVDNKDYIILKQLLRCGTSIGANVNEAGAAQTKRDFATKMALAAKEAGETHYWLSLLDQSKLVNLNGAIQLNKISEIIRLLTAIVKTTQSHL